MSDKEKVSALPTPDAGDARELVERLRSAAEICAIENQDAEANACLSAASRIKELEGERDAAKSGNRYAQLETQALVRIKELEAELAEAGEALSVSRPVFMRNIDLMKNRAERAERERDAARQDAYYHCLNASDVMERKNSAEALLERAKAALEPFSKVSGVPFERNFHANDLVVTITAADGAVVYLYASDFFAARSTLTAISSKGGGDAAE